MSGLSAVDLGPTLFVLCVLLALPEAKGFHRAVERGGCRGVREGMEGCLLPYGSPRERSVAILNHMHACGTMHVARALPSVC